MSCYTYGQSHRSEALKLIKLLLFITIIFNAKACMAQDDDLSNLLNPLASWRNGPAKKSILKFVFAATDKTSPGYIPSEQRIAVFDQDGTLWVEQPVYTQVMFAFDRIVSMADQHPDWKHTQPFQAIIERDKVRMAGFTSLELAQINRVTQIGMKVGEYKKAVQDWLAKARHPRWNRPYTDLVYQPMLEVLSLLRAKGFKTYIVTGSNQDFVRAYSQQVYGIPPEQVIGSALSLAYIFDPTVKGIFYRRAPLLINNNSGKPEDIYLFIGRAPKAAFGNSTGDKQMLEYTQQEGKGSLMMLIHHDDALREYHYSAKSRIGTFSDALMAEAKDSGWMVVSMKNDWKTMFPFSKPPGVLVG